MTSSPLTLTDAEALATSFLEARRAKHADFRMDATDGGDGGDNGGQADQTGQTNGNPEGQKPEETPEEKAARLEADLAEAKKHSRTWETRAKENKDAAKKLAEIEAANATPDQKLQAAEARAAKAERELARYRIAADTGLPVDLAEMLTGEDEEAMAEQAKKLLKRLAPTKQAPPKPDPSQGGSGGQQRASAADEGRAEAQRRIAARKKP